MIGFYLTGFSVGLGFAVILCISLRILSAVREVSDEI